MVMNAINYQESDFPMIREWWYLHHKNDFRPGYVSRTAYIVTSDGKPVGFFSMHPMDCDICYLGYPMVNPKADKEERDAAVDYIIECSKLWAMKTGHAIVYISIKGEKMLSRLEHNGFLAGEDGCKHMFCKIGEIR